MNDSMPVIVPGQVPATSASEVPVTRGMRVAFQVWTFAVLLTIVVTLGLYLFDKIYYAFTGR